MKILDLEYEPAIGPASVVYRPINAGDKFEFAHYASLSDGVSSDDYAIEAAQALCDLINERYAGANFVPATNYPYDKGLKRRVMRRRPKPLDVGPTTGQTASQLSRRCALLEKRINRLIQILTSLDAFSSEEEEDDE